MIKKCQTLPALKLTRPSLPEFPWHAQTLVLTVSASVFLQGAVTPRWIQAPFLVLEGQGSLEEEGEEGEEAAGGEWRERR